MPVRLLTENRFLPSRSLCYCKNQEHSWRTDLLHLTRRNCFEAIGGALGAARALAGAGFVQSRRQQTRPCLVFSRARGSGVEHPGSIIDGRYQAEPVRQMMRKGMAELTGADGWADAWRLFVEPGDMVGIKVNPVGQPHVISAAEVVREIIAGLNAAGVKNKDIVVYDRYRAQFLHAGFDKWLPEGVRTSNAAEDYDEVQQAIAGYDPDHYMDMALTLPGYDAEQSDGTPLLRGAFHHERGQQTNQFAGAEGPSVGR